MKLKYLEKETMWKLKDEKEEILAAKDNIEIKEIEEEKDEDTKELRTRGRNLKEIGGGGVAAQTLKLLDCNHPIQPRDPPLNFNFNLKLPQKMVDREGDTVQKPPLDCSRPLKQTFQIKNKLGTLTELWQPTSTKLMPTKLSPRDMISTD